MSSSRTCVMLYQRSGLQYDMTTVWIISEPGCVWRGQSDDTGFKLLLTLRPSDSGTMEIEMIYLHWLCESRS